MRHGKYVSSSIVAALALVWAGCGAAGAQDQNEVLATELEEQQEQGLFEGVHEPEFEAERVPNREPIVVPAGTLLVLRLQNTLSSHESPVGASFSGLVNQEVSIAGRIAIPADSIVRGHVVEARPAKKIGGRAILSLSFDELETPAGLSVILSARLAESGRSEVAKDAAIIGGGTIGGAIIGDAIHEGEGGTIGAIVGGVAGVVGALKTKGKPVVLPAGTQLPVALDNALTIEDRS